MTKEELQARRVVALKGLRDAKEVLCLDDHYIDIIEQENAELKADNDARKYAMAMSEKVEKQLREQIEKMKCCGNCRFNYCERSTECIDKDGNRTFHCWNEEKEKYCDVGKNGKYQCWELTD